MTAEIDPLQKIVRDQKPSAADNLRTKSAILPHGNTREIAEAWGEAGCAMDVVTLTEALDRLFLTAADKAVPVTDLGRLFSRLKELGLHLGIASSDSEAAIRRLVDRFVLGGLIDFIAGYDSGFGSKPEPGMLIAFCRAVAICPAEAAVIGDKLP